MLFNFVSYMIYLPVSLFVRTILSFGRNFSPYLESSKVEFWEVLLFIQSEIKLRGIVICLQLIQV